MKNLHVGQSVIVKRGIHGVVLGFKADRVVVGAGNTALELDPKEVVTLDEYQDRKAFQISRVAVKRIDTTKDKLRSVWR